MKKTKPQAQIDLFDEITVDGFCGGGGWSTGFELAIGEPVTIGINHDADAIAMHKKNHPYTKHYNENIFEVDPREACAGRSVGWAHFSPDCTHFSKAKGGKPVKKNIRGLAWVIVKWAGTVHPRIISMENVVEFMTWGPLVAYRDRDTGRVVKRIDYVTEKDQVTGDDEERPKYIVADPGEVVPYHQQMLVPDKKRAGRTFRAFCRAMKDLGYKYEFKALKACDFGAPTSRERLFGIFRRDGKPICWPEPTHGDPNSEEVKSGKIKPWRTAAEIIDWSQDCPSIFERKRPLAENTLKRIARGIEKFVIDNPEPFIVQVNHSGDHFRGQSIEQPMPTVTAKHGYGVVTPYIMCNNANNVGSGMNEPVHTITTGNRNFLMTPVMTAIGQTGFSEDRSYSVKAPVKTIVSKAEQCVVAPTLIQYHSEQSRREHRGQRIDRPIMTVDASPRYGLAAATLIQTGYGERKGQAPRVPGLDKPLGTIVSTEKHAAVTAFLSKYYGGGYKGCGSAADCPVGTITARDHNAVVTTNIVQLNNNCVGQAVTEPLKTITSGAGHFAEVRAMLIKFYGQGTGQAIDEPLDTVTAKDRFGLVTIRGVDYMIVDIGLRMLSPRELYAAQGFPPDYKIETDCYGNKYPKSKQVARCGNAVPPPFAFAIARANWPERCKGKKLYTMAALNEEIAV
jgi:DNA (cytosine-5)-methyltransferase 1